MLLGIECLLVAGVCSSLKSIADHVCDGLKYITMGRALATGAGEEVNHELELWPSSSMVSTVATVAAAVTAAHPVAGTVLSVSVGVIAASGLCTSVCAVVSAACQLSESSEASSLTRQAACRVKLCVKKPSPKWLVRLSVLSGEPVMAACFAAALAVSGVRTAAQSVLQATQCVHELIARNRLRTGSTTPATNREHISPHSGLSATLLQAPGIRVAASAKHRFSTQSE